MTPTPPLHAHHHRQHQLHFISKPLGCGGGGGGGLGAGWTTWTHARSVFRRAYPNDMLKGYAGMWFDLHYAGVTCSQEVGSVPGDLRINKEIKYGGGGVGWAWDNFNINVDSQPHSLPENPRPCDAWKEETKVQRKFPHPHSLWGNPGPVPGSQTSGLHSEKKHPTAPESTDHCGCCCCCCCFHKPKEKRGVGGDEKWPLRAARHRTGHPCSSSTTVET